MINKNSILKTTNEREIYFNIQDEVDAKENTSVWERAKVKISNMLDSSLASILLVSATLGGLYVDDVRSGFTQKSADYYFDSLFILCLIIFFIEFVVSGLVKKGYAFSFFFFLDFAAMISVVMNINFLMDLLSVTIKLPDFSYIAQSGRAGRAGTKVGRLMRIVRMIRMIRVAKFYKAAK